jgi:hypothetical protein
MPAKEQDNMEYVRSSIKQTTKVESGSDAGEFRKALLSLPYHLDLGF